MRDPFYRYLAGCAGLKPKPLVTHQEGELLLDPSWSSDGKYIYFTVDTSASEPITSTNYVPGADVRIDWFDLATEHASK